MKIEKKYGYVLALIYIYWFPDDIFVWKISLVFFIVFFKNCWNLKTKLFMKLHLYIIYLTCAFIKFVQLFWFIEIVILSNMYQNSLQFVIQITTFKKYKTLDPKVRLWILIVLNCPLIGALSSKTTNQWVAQNNCCIEVDFRDPNSQHIYYF